MKSFDGRVTALAACLSALAGYVDAIGFIELGGYFVSFMSGNSTRLAVATVGETGRVVGVDEAVLAGGLIATFVLGVVAGSLVGRLAEARRRPAVLLLVTALLTLAASSGIVSATTVAIVAMVLAMGAENAVFERDDEVHIGLTYMTGTLVKLGQRLTAAILGGDRLGWLPYFLLWLGLVAGACAGALVHARIGLGGLWFAAGAAGLCTFVAARLDRRASTTLPRTSECN